MADVLLPMRRGAGLSCDLARLVHRHRAIAGNAFRVSCYVRRFRPLLFDRDPWRGAGTAFFERRFYLRGDGAIDLGVLAAGIDSRDWAA